MALKTFVPQIEQPLSKLINLAMELNECSVEECQMAQSLFASDLPKDSKMYEHVSQDLSRSGSGKDYFKARDTCQKEEDARAKVKEAEANQPDLLLANYNLLIKVAEKAKIPKDMSEAMLSMVGTIIKNDGKTLSYEALVNKDEETWNTHVKGGKNASLYQYEHSNPTCLKIKTLTGQTISKEKSYQEKAALKLERLRKKFQANIPFSNEDVDFFKLYR